MSGKPSSTPRGSADKTRPAKRSSGKPSSDKPSSKQPTAKRAKREDPSDDDPFDVDQTAVLKAIRATPRPAKGRLHKVTCPMCDTVGFVPKKAIGKDIRCANKDCMVPIFKVPTKKPKGDPRPVTRQVVEETSSRSPLILYGGIAALVIATGLGVLFVIRGKDKTNNLDMPFDTSASTSSSADLEYKSRSDKTKTKQGDTEPQVASIDYAGLRAKTLKDMIAEARDATRTRKPYCRRLTADSQALAGNFKQASKELDYLMRIDKRLGYYRIQPWSRIAMENLKAGDATAAATAIDNALAAKQSLPGYGRTPIDMVTVLAAAMVSANRDKEVETLLKKHSRDQSIEANLSEGLLSASVSLQREGQVAGLDELLNSNGIAWADPQRTVIAGIAMLNGMPDRAVEWLLKQDADVRADCVALCSELAALQFRDQGSRANLDRLITAIPDGPLSVLTKAVAARCLAGSKKHGDMAQAYFTEAETAFAAIPDFESATTPDVKASLTYRLPSSGPVRTATLTGTELICAASIMGNDKVQDLLTRTLQFPQAIAPPFGVARRRLSEAIDQPARIKAQLRRVLNTSTSGLQAAVRKYKAQWKTIAAASRTRRQLLANVIRRASDVGLHEFVWTLVPGLKSDEIMGTDSVWHVVDAYNAAGKKTEMRQAIDQIRKSKNSLSPLGELSRRLDVQLQSGRTDQALRAVNSANASLTDRSGAIIRTVLGNTREGQLNSVLKFVKGLKHAPLREETLDLVAAQALRFKDPEEVRRLIDQLNFSAADRVAGYHGIAVGLGRSIPQDTAPAGG